VVLIRGARDVGPSWTTLSRRAAGLPAHEPSEGVPEWLYPQLQQWLYRVLQHTDGPIVVLRPAHGYTADTREVMLRLRTATQPWLLGADDLLDAVDAALRWVDSTWQIEDEDFSTDEREVERLLAAANSTWRTSEQFHGLERRVDLTVTAAVAEAIQTTGHEAADHLRASWSAAYGRNPNPDAAYSEAVKAVEAVACPAVLPSATTATLGRVRDHLRDAPDKWEVALPGKDGSPTDTGVLVTMLTSLWEGQRSRHAGTPASRRQQQIEAVAAVHLATTLVQWFTVGVLRRKP
jgi:hypothetical protein